MIHSLFIVTVSGDVVIEKHWREVLPRSLVDTFMKEVRSYSKPENTPPVISTPKFYFFSVFTDSLFFIAPVAGEIPALYVIECLHRIVDILRTYLEGRLNEDSLRNNFGVVLQVLDEMLDNGYPLITEPNTLTSLIAPPTVGKRVGKFLTGKTGVSAKLGAEAMSVIPWRKNGVKYLQNELYFDIIEEVDVIQEPNGSITRHNLCGFVRCNCKLSGTPDLLLQFVNPRLIADASLHPCVRVSRFQRDQAVSFVPPDGEFELLRYRCPEAPLQLPLFCRPEVHWREGGARVTFTIGQKPMAVRSASVSSQRSAPAKDIIVEDVRLKITFPAGVTSADLTSQTGKVSYKQQSNELLWQIGRVTRETTVSLTGLVSLAAGERKPREGITAIMHFAVANTTASGVAVKEVTLSKERYEFKKVARCTLRTGRYQIRA